MPSARQNADIAELATRQHGLVTRGQLASSDLSRRQIDRLVASGRLLSIERGVYQMAGAPTTWHARVLATCLSVDGIASHRSAAVLHGLAIRPGRPEVSVRRQSDARICAARVHWSTDLDRTAPVHVAGIPTTPIDRTLVDLGAVVGDRTVERAIDAAIASRRITWPEILDVYRVHSRPGRRGCGPLRRILDERFGDAQHVESHIEGDLRDLFIRYGLTGFVTQFDVYDELGFIMRVDFAWPEFHVFVEADSLAFHLNATAFQEDRRKRNRVRLGGNDLFEYTALDIDHRPDTIASQVRTALVRNGWAG